MRQGPRLLAVTSLALLGACPAPGDDDPAVPGGACFVDEECVTGEACGRDGVCWPQAEIRHVKTTWTLRGMPASVTSCERHPDFYIEFNGPSVADELRYSPVPCEIGQYVVDKLPRPFTKVEVGIKNGPWARTTIDASGVVELDLSFF